MPIASVNPATGETLQTFQELLDSEVDQKIALSATAFARHRLTTFADRSKWMLNAAKILEQEKTTHARFMVDEMGKPVTGAIAEVEKCAWVCRYYAENAERFLAEESIQTDAQKSFTRCLPLGPVLAVMPWNFPYWQVFRFAAPALMAGNTGLLKHSSNVPRCALAIEKVLTDAGFAAGVFQTLLIGSKKVERVLKDKRVVAATLTGSEGAGMSIASIAGHELKKTVLELGGSDPFIVLPSAHVEHAAKTAVAARTINSGQSCIAAKRFIVHEKVYDRFAQLFTQGMAGLKVGDPTESATQIGPLATEQIVEDLESQVKDAVAKGAKLLTGGKRRPGKGNFYEPTVLAEIPEQARIHQEEVFGPVATLWKVKSVEEAIRVANDSPYGLASSVWTTDAKEQEQCIRDIEAGQTFFNALVASDPRLPFGGVKKSGYGRELSREGIREFVNLKTVVIQATQAPVTNQASE
jgi:succinate-semialdehyde dehydrogenase/glutarate-semialdehyde dehydrogenase